MTDAEQQELIRLRKEKQEREDAEAKSQKSGIMDAIGGFFSGGFDFGTIIFGLLLVTGIYFAARTPEGQKLIAGMFGEGGDKKVADFFLKGDAMINGVLESIGIKGFAPEAAAKLAMAMPFKDVQEKLVGLGFTQEQAQLTAPDQVSSTSLMDFLFKNGGKMSGFTPDLLNEKTVFALLTQKSDLVRKLIDTVPAGSSDSKMMGQLTDAMKKILGNPTQFTALATNPQSFETIAYAAARFSGLPVSAQNLGDFIKTVGFDAQGKPTKELGDFLTVAMTGSAQTLPAFVAFLSANPNSAEAVATLARSIDLTKVTDANTRDALQLLQYNAPQTLALLTGLGPEKTAKFLEMLQKSEGAGLSFSQLHALKPEVIAAAARGDAKVPVATIQSIVSDAQGKFSLPQTVNSLLTSEGRQALREFGTDNLAALGQAQGAPATFTARNLDAVLDFSKTIATNPVNQKSADDTRAMMQALSSVVVHPQTQPLKDMKPEQIAAFFHDETNAAAFGTLLGRIDRKGLDTKQIIKLEVLSSTWGTAQGGIAQVLGDKDGATLVLQKLNDPAAATCTKRTEPGTVTDISNWFAQIGAGIVYGDVVKANMPQIQLLQQRLEVANCDGKNVPSAPKPLMTVKPAAAHEPVFGFN